MDERLNTSALAKWLQTQPEPKVNPGQKKPPVQWDFVSTSACLVGQYLKATWPDPEKTPVPRFDDGSWANMFPGVTFTERLRNYHFICDTAPYTYKGALERIASLGVKV
jgi:hypothetical protein